jgi:hypothetical protein
LAFGCRIPLDVSPTQDAAIVLGDDDVTNHETAVCFAGCGSPTDIQCWLVGEKHHTDHSTVHVKRKKNKK